MLNLIHEWYLGLNKCKLRAKDTVYWPGLNEQLEKLVLNCELCLKYSLSKHKHKSSQSLGQEIPVHPWTKLATNIFHLESSSYLLIMDYTSRFPVVCKLSLMTGLHIANQCKQTFSEYGWSETLISDNCPCYTSQAFTSTMQLYCFNHITSSLYYPQSNGLAGKYIQIVKACSTKQKEEDIDFYKHLMIYHNTSLTGSLLSLMQILQNRNARSQLPMSNAASKQLGIQPEIIRNSDRHAVLPTHDLNVGQHVMYQDSSSKHLYPAVIDSLCSEPRSYKVITRGGIVYRKTQSHLKPFTLQNKISQSTKCVSSPMAQSNHKLPVKTESKKRSQVNNQLQVQTSRPKSPQSSLIAKYFRCLLSACLDI